MRPPGGMRPTTLALIVFFLAVLTVYVLVRPAPTPLAPTEAPQVTESHPSPSQHTASRKPSTTRTPSRTPSTPPSTTPAPPSPSGSPNDTLPSVTSPPVTSPASSSPLPS